MTKQNGQCVLHVAVFGGDGRSFGPYPAGIAIQHFPGRKYSRRGIRSLRSQMQRGEVDRVLLLVRWMGHPECGVVRGNCQRWNIPCHTIQGGRGEMRRWLEIVAATQYLAA